MNPKTIVLVLWGEGCDETLAVGWVSRLRAEGTRVYLVGVSGRRLRGRYGVGLQMDVGLEEAIALVPRASQVMLPCTGEWLAGLRRDPRFEAILRQAQAAGAVLVAPADAVAIVREIAPDAIIRSDWDGGQG